MYSDLVTRFNHVCLKWCPTKTQFVFLCLASVSFFPDLASKLLDIKNYSVKVSIEISDGTRLVRMAAIY